MKISPADTWFSRCVRERASWACERCGKYYAPPTNALQCSHFVGRENYATRFEPLCAFSHCYSCHTFFHGNPHLFTDWAKEKLGIDLYDLLIEKSNDIDRGRLARRSKKAIAVYYKSEYERMLSVRAEGITGRLEFVGW